MPQILIANAGITDESTHPPIWELETTRWDAVHEVNVRGTFLTIKHFLRAVKDGQNTTQKELDNVAILVTGSETGVFGQEGHAEYSSGKAGLQYGLVKTVKNEIVRLNSKARINAVAPGWINTAMIDGRLDDPYEKWAESEATVALRKIAEPTDAARAMAFLASHRTAGHITGQCISIDGGQEGRLLWRTPSSASAARAFASATIPTSNLAHFPKPVSRRKRTLRICLSVDFDGISGYMGTGYVPENKLADYSAGLFGANIGVGRLLTVFRKHKVADQVTWFIPGHSMESFPDQTRAVINSGAEIGLHGYSHESAYAMTPEQERDVLDRCIEIASSLQGGKKPIGYRAPLYEIRESTVMLLQERGFLYDSSLNAYDSIPYMLATPFIGNMPHIPDYSKPASSWMKPFVDPNSSRPSASGIIEIPSSWYTEDATPMGFYPHSPSTHGYVSVDVVEQMWWNRFEWLWNNESWVDQQPGRGYGSVFPVVLHPECAGRSHIIGMIDRFVAKLVARMNEAEDGEITFETMESVARSWTEGP